MFSHGLCENGPVVEKYPDFIGQKEDDQGNHSFYDFDKEVYIDSNDYMSKKFHIWGWGIGYREREDLTTGKVEFLGGYPDTIDVIEKYTGKGVGAWF